MKRLMFCAVSLLPFLFSQVLAEDSQGWQPTLDAARKTASQSNRLVLIYFQADWCKACRAMERDTLSQPAVMQNLQPNYAAVKINADFLPMTAKQYGVTLLPTTVVTTADGQLVDKMTGAVDAQQFVGRLNQVAAYVRRQNAANLAQVTGGPAAAPGYGLPATQPAPSMQNSAMYRGPASTVPTLVGTGAPQSVAPPTNDRYADWNRSNNNPAVNPNVAPPANPMPNPTVNPVANPATDPRLAFTGPVTTGAYGVGTGMAPTGIGPVGVAPQPAMPAAPGVPYAPQTGMMAGTMPGVGAPTNNATLAPSAPAGVAPVAPVVPPPVDAVNPPLGLDGYCPVALAEQQKWIAGDRRWGLVHRGRTYLFSGQAERDRFNANPDAYAPVMSGVDVVVAFDQGQQVPGRRECGVFYGKKVYLFADEASLKKFEQNRVFYANQVLQAMRSTANGGNIYR